MNLVWQAEVSAAMVDLQRAVDAYGPKPPPAACDAIVGDADGTEPHRVGWRLAGCTTSPVRAP